jgi:hypothetical protein
MAIRKFGNKTYPWHIRCGLNLGPIVWGKKAVLWAGKYGKPIQLRTLPFLTE